MKPLSYYRNLPDSDAEDKRCKSVLEKFGVTHAVEMQKQSDYLFSSFAAISAKLPPAQQETLKAKYPHVFSAIIQEDKVQEYSQLLERLYEMVDGSAKDITALNKIEKDIDEISAAFVKICKDYTMQRFEIQLAISDAGRLAAGLPVQDIIDLPAYSPLIDDVIEAGVSERMRKFVIPALNAKDKIFHSASDKDRADTEAAKARLMERLMERMRGRR